MGGFGGLLAFVSVLFVYITHFRTIQSGSLDLESLKQNRS